MVAGTAGAQTPATKTFAQITAPLRRLDGLAPVFVDEKTGRVLLELPAPDAKGVVGRYLYQVYLRAGLGSNPVGLDRSKPGPTQILVFRRTGTRVLAEYENDGFRAGGGSADEQHAVADSFAVSTVWAGDIMARGPDGGLLVDISGFLDRDAFGIADALKDAKQGAFKLDKDLSHPNADATLAFPDNLEFEASQTFAGDEPGPEIKAIAPDPHLVTLVVHHSLIALPPPGYKPRLYDPRVGVFNQLVNDYSAPLDAPLVYRLANRFRLEKTDPAAACSPVKKPIVFYVDRAAPEPVRAALVEGARWWAQAFDAAGFVDAFKVEVLPEGVSSLDARYNVINWVHRQTRGWSYGQGIIDPRTGEIVKGSVLLGSLRVRQDRMIFEGLVGADKTGTGGQDDPIRISLSRLRQLAVHETGHALGLAHNFAGSTFGDRASVMDYPPPRIAIVGGRFDFSDAYATGVGSWDKFAIRWLYSQTPPGVDEKVALKAIVRDGYAAGLRFVDDDNSRPADAAQPYGNLWDDGPDAVAALAHVLEVRRIALSRFGLANLPAGAPAADLRRAIVPIYLFHRYEVDAVAKLIGGVDFTYAVKGDGHEAARPVSGPDQRRALGALLATVGPGRLDLPEPLLSLLSSAQSGVADPQFDAEVFGEAGGPVFDLPTAADAAADITLSDLLQPQRLNRVVDLGARDGGQLGLDELLDKTIAAVFSTPPEGGGRTAELRRRVQMRLVVDLAQTLEDKRLSPTAAARIKAALTALGTRLATVHAGDPADLALARYLSAILLDTTKDAIRTLAEADKARAGAVPPGAPIGADREDCWLCEPLGRTPERSAHDR
ncbi:MAG: zinc-dependent metalloprotease [Caulobacteraceae bacterium]